jgi:peptidoglycan/xylan/chitin deacetylase (PgdA/CDA1 family)
VGDVLVLAYHAVSDEWPSQLAVTRDELRRQLRHLVGRGYRGATVSDALRAGTADRVVAVTFDDGYLSVLDAAFPILSELGLPGTVFVATDHVGADGPMSWPGIEEWLGGPHEHELRPLSWEQLALLAGAGWEIGSHTRSHPRLSRIEDDRLRDELAGSRSVIERRLGRACPTLAYPYGDHDGRVEEAAAAAGYTWACALPDRTLPPGPMRLDRVGLYRDEPQLRFRAKVSPLVRRLRATGRFEPLVRVLRRA